MGDIHLRKFIELKSVELEAMNHDGKKKKYSTQNSIHIFKGHSRRVTSLAPVKSKNTYFVSASLDGKVRIWCIEKMIELYCFDISLDSTVLNSASADSIVNVKLISDSIYAMMFNRNIEIGLISHLASSYFISKQRICSLGKCFISADNRQANQPNLIYISFSDSSIVMMNPEDQFVCSTLYPPPTPTEVCKVFWCQSIQRMLLHLQSGSICVYKTNKETGILERLLEPKQFKDYEDKSVNQGVTFINTCFTKPPAFDCLIFSDLHKYKEPLHPEYVLTGSREDFENNDVETFLVMGLSKGSIIFVSLDNLDHVYARFSLHRQEVTSVTEVKEHRIFISICSELDMNIFGFNDHREVLYQKMNVYREVFRIVACKANQIFMCFQNGGNQMLVWNQEINKMQRLKTDKGDEHDEAITCIDTLIDKNLFVTGDQKGLVKIWNHKKKLLREIKFVEPVNSVIFLNPNADLIVGHSGNLSKLKAEDYLKKAVDMNSDPEFQHLLSHAKTIDDQFFKDLANEKVSASIGKKTDQQLNSEYRGEESEEVNLRQMSFNNKSGQVTEMSTMLKLKETQNLEVPAQALISQELKTSQRTAVLNLSSGGRHHHPQSTQAVNVYHHYHPNSQLMDHFSNTQSQSSHAASIQQANMKKQIQKIRQEAVKIPSVPPCFGKLKERQQEQRRIERMMNGNTRRMMTYMRISDNILKFNNPCCPNNFKDVLVNGEVNRLPLVEDSIEDQEAQPLIYRRDVKIGQSNQSVNNYYTQVKNQQNTFSIFDQNSFDNQIRKSEDIHQKHLLNGSFQKMIKEESSVTQELTKKKLSADDRSYQTVVNNLDGKDIENTDSPMKNGVYHGQFILPQEEKNSPSHFSHNADESPAEIKKVQTLIDLENSRHQSEMRFLDMELKNKRTSRPDESFLNPILMESCTLPITSEEHKLVKKHTLTMQPTQEDRNENQFDSGHQHTSGHMGSPKFIKLQVGPSLANTKTTNAQVPMQQHEMPLQIVYKQFSQQIRGSNRMAVPGEFVSTRLQQKANQMQQVSPHIITNAKLKKDVGDYFSVNMNCNKNCEVPKLSAHCFSERAITRKAQVKDQQKQFTQMQQTTPQNGQLEIPNNDIVRIKTSQPGNRKNYNNQMNEPEPGQAGFWSDEQNSKSKIAKQDLQMTQERLKSSNLNQKSLENCKKFSRIKSGDQLRYGRSQMPAKNTIQSGLHCPAKGIFNASKKYPEKPQTAGRVKLARQALIQDSKSCVLKLNQMTLHNFRSTNFSGFPEYDSFKPKTRVQSAYKHNMVNLNALSNISSGATGPGVGLHNMAKHLTSKRTASYQGAETLNQTQMQSN